jgi:hypothetical protein
MALQDELNRINKTTLGRLLTIRECFQSLAGGDQNRSTNALANAYCGTTDQTIQDALNTKAGRNLATQERLSKTAAAELIPTP